MKVHLHFLHFLGVGRTSLRDICQGTISQLPGCFFFLHSFSPLLGHYPTSLLVSLGPVILRCLQSFELFLRSKGLAHRCCYHILHITETLQKRSVLLHVPKFPSRASVRFRSKLRMWGPSRPAWADGDGNQNTLPSDLDSTAERKTHGTNKFSDILGRYMVISCFNTESLWKPCPVAIEPQAVPVPLRLRTQRSVGAHGRYPSGSTHALHGSAHSGEGQQCTGDHQSHSGNAQWLRCSCGNIAGYPLVN